MSGLGGSAFGITKFRKQQDKAKKYKGKDKDQEKDTDKGREHNLDGLNEPPPDDLPEAEAPAWKAAARMRTSTIRVETSMTEENVKSLTEDLRKEKVKTAAIAARNKRSDLYKEIIEHEDILFQAAEPHVTDAKKIFGQLSDSVRELRDNLKNIDEKEGGEASDNE